MDLAGLFQKINMAETSCSVNMKSKRIKTKHEHISQPLPPSWLQNARVAVQSKQVTFQDALNGLYTSTTLPEDAVVCNLAGVKKTLRRGILELTSRIFLVLGPNCSEARFQEMEIEGNFSKTGAACNMSFKHD